MRHFDARGTAGRAYLYSRGRASLLGRSRQWKVRRPTLPNPIVFITETWPKRYVNLRESSGFRAPAESYLTLRRDMSAEQRTSKRAPQDRLKSHPRTKPPRWEIGSRTAAIL